MLLERTRPADAKLMLQTYRNWLASKSKEGRPNVEAGPVTLGVRLSSSHFPNGYEIITYSRGTWLIHMLRWMLRDASRTPEKPCLLYTSDAADEEDSVDLGGRRIIK